jgi:hypothetical protein
VGRGGEARIAAKSVCEAASSSSRDFNAGSSITREAASAIAGVETQLPTSLSLGMVQCCRSS